MSEQLLEYLTSAVLTHLDKVHKDMKRTLVRQVTGILCSPEVAAKHGRARFADVYEITMVLFPFSFSALSVSCFSFA